MKQLHDKSLHRAVRAKKSGAGLTDTLQGVTQGGVFLLQKADGTVDPDQVLKVVFKFGIGGVFGMTNLEREWRVGRHLALLTEPGEALPGFMGTGAGIVTKSGKFRGDFNACCTAQAFCWPHSYEQRLCAATVLSKRVLHEICEMQVCCLKASLLSNM